MPEINHFYVILPLLSFISTISLAVIALLKRGNSRVNIWFAASALWWALIPLIFIIHHLTDDQELLLRAERVVEFFFMYGVPLQIVLFHRLCNIRKIPFEIILTAISFLFSLTAFSEYCIIGVRKYSWGYIAYGGLTFNLFALYALMGIVYGIVFIYRQYKVQENEIIRIRIKYIMSSYIVMNVLTLLNLPAINGIDIYPPGNFSFIPLMLIGYSLLKYRLLDINQFLLKSIIWIIAVLSVILPIEIASWGILLNAERINTPVLAALLTALFSLLLLYFRYLLPLLSEKIQKQSYDFREAISDFSSKIVQVKSLKQLAGLVFTLIESKIFASSVSLLLKDFNDNSFRIYSSEGQSRFSGADTDFFHTLTTPELLEKDQVEVNPVYRGEREKYLRLFRELDSEIIIPLLFDSMFIGSINIGRKAGGKYKRLEVQFLEQMVNSINIAFSNSLLLSRIEELNLSLENKVEERTCQLQEANLRLRELDKVKSDFFANISHEIRTPLTLILGPVESVLQGDFDDNKIDRSFFENLRRNALILLKLINDLLDFSKIEAGQMKLKVRELDMASFIKTYTASFHSAAELKGISIDFIQPEEPVLLYADPGKLDRIIMNLFSNSLKFTGPGGFIRVTLKTGEGLCRIIFEDSGTGIPPDKIDSVFDRFYQGDSGTTRRYEGTGIGLALVKEFTALHGGEVSVSSRHVSQYPDDHGTELTVTIPMGRDHLMENENISCVDPDEDDPARSFHSSFDTWELTEFRQWKDGETGGESPAFSSRAGVLIVDDNPDMRSFLGFLLMKDYNLFYAAHGEEGLERARTLRPDLIISDVMMPVMDGYNMTERLKRDPVLQHIPVVLLTAKAETADRIEGLEYGADDYLTKPFSSRELLTRVRGLLKTRGYELALERRNSEIEADLKTARLIQNRLLPQNVPEMPGYGFHSLYIPMDEVGGDFYDYRAEEKRIEIFISDVSGHGLVSAFIALIAKVTLDSIPERGSSAEVLRHLNSVVCKSSVNTNYMTAFYCVIDTDSGVMKFTSAGHIPPYIYRKGSDTFHELSTRGRPLGLFNDLELNEEEVQLQDGDRVVLFTDGVTECMNSLNELYGENRLKEFIRDNSDLEGEPFSAKLIEELSSFTGSSRFPDDICLLVFDVKHRTGV